MPFDARRDYSFIERLKETGNRTLARRAIATQVVANGAGAAAGVLWSREAQLRASSVVYLALISSWLLKQNQQTDDSDAPSAGMSISVNHVREAAYLSGCPCRTPSCEPPHSSYFSKQQGCARLSWWPFPAVLIPHLPTRVFHLQPAKKIWINSIFRARPKSAFLSFSQHGTNEFLETQAECRRRPSFKVQMLSFSLHSNLLKLAHLFLKAC